MGWASGGRKRIGKCAEVVLQQTEAGICPPCSRGVAPQHPNSYANRGRIDREHMGFLAISASLFVNYSLAN